MSTSAVSISYSDILQPIIAVLPYETLKCVVIIPAFAEPDLSNTIQSLEKANKKKGEVELIILINESEQVEIKHSKVNQKSFLDAGKLKSTHLPVHIVYIKNIPLKIAGVGTARKIAMDLAAQRLAVSGRTKDGIIVNLDADCTVSENYFIEIFKYFDSYPGKELGNIHFEHILEQSSNENERKAIASYELHLRYFIGMQRWLGLPYAYHTIGSAFAVKAGAYHSVGGMNRRKAGEDFYFIHKFTKKETIGEINSCTVFPSSRPSFRVPFGTGKAVSEILVHPGHYRTYHPQSFFDLRHLVEKVDDFFTMDVDNFKSDIPVSVRSYLEQKDFFKVLTKLKTNAKSLKTFRKAFYQWFDAFRLMKYLHWARDHHYANIDLFEAILQVHRLLGVNASKDPEKSLLELRKIQKSR